MRAVGLIPTKLIDESRLVVNGRDGVLVIHAADEERNDHPFQRIPPHAGTCRKRGFFVWKESEARWAPVSTRPVAEFRLLPHRLREDFFRVRLRIKTHRGVYMGCDGLPN